LDCAGGEEFDGAGIFAGRCAGALQADLARDDFLQREIDVRSDVSDEDDGAAFAGGVDGSDDGFGPADTFEGDVDALIVGELENLRLENFVGEQSFRGAELFGECEAVLIDVSDKNFFAACGAEGLQSEDADGAGADNESGVGGLEMSEIYCVDGDGDGFEHGGFGEGEIIGEGVKDARGDGHEFGEGSGTTVVTAGDAEDLAVVAKIYITTEAVGTGAAVDGGVESDAIAWGEFFYVGADGFDDAGGFVSHDERRDAAAGGAVVAVDIAAADAAGGYADEDFVGRGSRDGKVGEFEIFVGGEEKSFHGRRGRLAEGSDQRPETRDQRPETRDQRPETRD